VSEAEARLLADYLAHASERAAGRQGDETFWTVEAVEDLRRRDPESLWSFLRAALRQVQDDAAIAYIAAGPLEDLLVESGEAFIDRIEQEAGREPNVLRALCGVWGRSRMVPAVAARLDRLIAGEPPL
jgi:hypothetical protein